MNRAGSESCMPVPSSDPRKNSDKNPTEMEVCLFQHKMTMAHASLQVVRSTETVGDNAVSKDNEGPSHNPTHTGQSPKQDAACTEMALDPNFADSPGELAKDDGYVCQVTSDNGNFHPIAAFAFGNLESTFIPCSQPNQIAGTSLAGISDLSNDTSISSLDTIATTASSGILANNFELLHVNRSQHSHVTPHNMDSEAKTDPLGHTKYFDSLGQQNELQLSVSDMLDSTAQSIKYESDITMRNHAVHEMKTQTAGPSHMPAITDQGGSGGYLRPPEIPSTVAEMEMDTDKPTKTAHSAIQREKTGFRGFLINSLDDPRCNPPCIKWHNKQQGQFEIVDGEALAAEWSDGRKIKVKFRNFKRNMRNHCKSVRGKKSTYQFKGLSAQTQNKANLYGRKENESKICYKRNT